MLEKLEPIDEQDPAQGRMRVMMDDPEKYFYYSKVCSMCGTSNVPPTKNCDYCLNQTVWDTKEEYAFFRTNVLAAGSKKILLGSVQIFFGGVYHSRLCVERRSAGSFAWVFSIRIDVCWRALVDDARRHAVPGGTPAEAV